MLTKQRPFQQALRRQCSRPRALIVCIIPACFRPGCLTPTHPHRGLPLAWPSSAAGLPGMGMGWPEGCHIHAAVRVPAVEAASEARCRVMSALACCCARAGQGCADDARPPSPSRPQRGVFDAPQQTSPMVCGAGGPAALPLAKLATPEWLQSHRLPPGATATTAWRGDGRMALSWQAVAAMSCRAGCCPVLACCCCSTWFQKLLLLGV